jgi:hypothetical protein
MYSARPGAGRRAAGRTARRRAGSGRGGTAPVSPGLAGPPGHGALSRIRALHGPPVTVTMIIMMGMVL